MESPFYDFQFMSFMSLILLLVFLCSQYSRLKYSPIIILSVFFFLFKCSFSRQVEFFFFLTEMSESLTNLDNTF